MNKKRVEEILELMEKYGLTEIDVEEEGVKIHLKKGTGANSAHIIQQPMHIAMPPIAHHSAPAVPNAPSHQEAEKNKKNLLEVKSPMVGTFYRAPAPDAAPYVDIGQAIKEGDVLCIIEAMKLMNEIKSEVKGKIAEIFVENGQAVEFGQVLFLVEPI